MRYNAELQNLDTLLYGRETQILHPFDTAVSWGISAWTWHRRVHAGFVLKAQGRTLVVDASATWYIGLIRDDSYSELAAADTMASHAGWEEGDEYDEATREVYTEAAAASKSINNTGNEAEFTISGTETFKGAFLVDENTISGSTETLFCTALFTEGDRAAVDGDTLKVGYTVTLAAA